MPSFYSSSAARPSCQTLVDSFVNHPDLPFHDVLSAEDVQHVFDEAGQHFATGVDDVYTPAVVLAAWLWQCLSGVKSCVAAVARVAALRVALGLPPCSAATGAYCKARAKLSEDVLRKLTLKLGHDLEANALPAWRWHGRRVLLVDGTGATMADTAANQAAFPQNAQQQPGCGWPLMRLVVLLTFATAGLVGAALGPSEGKESGETALFRTLLDQLLAGDVVVADRYYCSYFLVALLQQRGVAVAFRLHQRRQVDYTRATRLGPGDHQVCWPKPDRPEWMDEATYASLPNQLTVRLVAVRVLQPGFRTRRLTLATTLLDAAAYSAADVGELYRSRWHVELDIRSIKQTLKMEHLSCKTPEQVRKEVWVHLLGYNLIRKVMAQAAWESGKQPRELSFAGAVQTVEACRGLWVNGAVDVLSAGRAVLSAVAFRTVGNRPDRVEPRVVKRRPKPFKHLRRPRKEARAALLNRRSG